MREVYQQVTIQLFALEGTLRELELWSEQPPEPRRLRSSAPFACDQLTLPEWLQFIFLPRMHALVQEGRALPDECNIAPYAEEWLASQGLEARELLALLREIDALISA